MNNNKIRKVDNILTSEVSSTTIILITTGNIKIIVAAIETMVSIVLTMVGCILKRFTIKFKNRIYVLITDMTIQILIKTKSLNKMEKCKMKEKL